MLMPVLSSTSVNPLRVWSQVDVEGHIQTELGHAQMCLSLWLVSE